MTQIPRESHIVLGKVHYSPLTITTDCDTLKLHKKINDECCNRVVKWHQLYNIIIYLTREKTGGCRGTH